MNTLKNRTTTPAKPQAVSLPADVGEARGVKTKAALERLEKALRHLSIHGRHVKDRLYAQRVLEGQNIQDAANDLAGDK